jgi:16S rRNA (guanine527-N7)-methyltransferase
MSVAEALRALLAEDVVAAARLDEPLLDRVTTHSALVSRWNPVHNLTRAEGDAAARVHYADSLLGCLALEPLIEGRQSLVDVGSGLGLPGLVAAALWPQREVTLLDSSRKRVSFLQRAISQMGLKNARAEHGRAQDVSRRWSVVLSRATFPWRELGPLALAGEPGGVIAAFVSDAPSVEDWERQSAAWATKSPQIVHYKVPGIDHRAVLIATAS